MSRCDLVAMPQWAVQMCLKAAFQWSLNYPFKQLKIIIFHMKQAFKKKSGDVAWRMSEIELGLIQVPAACMALFSGRTYDGLSKGLQQLAKDPNFRQLIWKAKHPEAQAPEFPGSSDSLQPHSPMDLP